MFMANSDEELIPLSQPSEMKNLLDQAGVANQLVVLPGHAHAITYAQRIWPQTVSWLQRYLGGRSSPVFPLVVIASGLVGVLALVLAWRRSRRGLVGSLTLRDDAT